MRRLGFPSHLLIKPLQFLLKVYTFRKPLTPSLLILAIVCRNFRIYSQVKNNIFLLKSVEPCIPTFHFPFRTLSLKKIYRT